MPDLYNILSARHNRLSYKSGTLFGVVEPPQAHLMAYSKRLSSGEWDANKRVQAIVSSEYDIEFAPLDHNPDYEKFLNRADHKCDAVLFNSAEHVVVFVELKDRDIKNTLKDVAAQCVEQDSFSELSEVERDNWLVRAVAQLRETICRFKQSNPEEYNEIRSIHCAYISNRQCGYGQEFSAAETQEVFKKVTDFSLYINTRIDIKKLPPPIRFRLLNDETLDELEM